MSKQGKQPQAIGRALGKAVGQALNNPKPFKPGVKPNQIGQINMRQGMANQANARAHTTGVAMQNAVMNGTTKQAMSAMNTAIGASNAATRANNNLQAAMQGQPMPRQGGVTAGLKPLRMAKKVGPQAGAPVTANTAGPLMKGAPKVAPKAGEPVKGGNQRRLKPF